MSYTANTYGDRIAAVYDEWVGPIVDPTTDACAAFLAEIAGGGPVLELGIGTGRIALPLAARGLQVHGIDASQAMVDQLRDKPGGAAIPVVVGDFADVPVEGEFALVFVVFNTFFALLSQDEQVRCLRNVAAHLTSTGRFVIEAFVPDVSRFDRGQRMSATRVDVDRVQLEATRHDPVLQRISTQNIVISSQGIFMLPVQLRYAWPSELDLMARLAGLRLEARFGGWQGEPFSSASLGHVSVYTKT